MYKTLFCIIFLTWLTFCEGCKNEYRMRETMEIVKKIINKYSIPILDKEDGKNSLIMVIPNEKIEIDDVEYFLNSADHNNPDLTFTFNLFRFYNTPVFVEPLFGFQQAYFNGDKSMLLRRIGRKCPKGETLCGLECCSERIRDIQKKFITKNQLDNGMITYENNLFSINKENIQMMTTDKNKICEFKLNKYDPIFPVASKIYYSCPKSLICCELSCEQPLLQPEAVAISARILDAPFWEDVKLYFYPIASLSLFLIFIITLWIIKRQSSKMASIKKSESTDTTESDDLSEMFDTIQSSRSTRLLIGSKMNKTIIV